MIAHRFVAAAILGAVFTTPAAAHDVWLESEAGTSPRIVVAYGHPGDRSLPDKARLYTLDLVSGAQPASLLGDLSARQEGAPVLVSTPISHKGGAVVVARFDNGFWAQTPYGTKNTNRLNAPDAQRSMWSQKFAKVLVAGDGADFTKPVGQRLEIVPLSDPFKLKAGEALRVRVMFEGKPLNGADVGVGDGQSKEESPSKVKTDAEGVVSIALKAQGLSVLVVSHSALGSVPQLAANDALTATLSVTR